MTSVRLGAAALQMLIRALPLGWSVTASIYYDQGNHLFSVTLLDSDTFTVPTPLPDDVSWYPLTLNPLDSMTSVFHVVSSGIGDELTADVNLGQMDPDPVPSAALACPA
jgi:hypothetical protein